ASPAPASGAAPAAVNAPALPGASDSAPKKGN
ncbi:MAG: acetyl-CoA carboxylase biotin carboxyl carrier protein subunit, partial [Betaproteobacteria bacterium]|nr:acetyl-CoA carboxylase biotin carboxyl carrier protein subunit [Betaproteobacteria bacterium]